MSIKGTGVALITPFTGHHEVDEPALTRLVNHCIDGGVDFLVVLGTTGEGATLSAEEKARVQEIVATANNGRLPLVLGVGGNNTRAVAKAASEVDAARYRAVLSVSPYYNKPTQEGIFQHFKTVSEASSVPVILYNVPGRTASNMTADTTLRIARECPNVMGIKEASGNLEQVMQILAGRPDGFHVYSGDDALTIPMIYMGAEGVISVMGQAYPRAFSNAVRYAMEGQLEQANRLHYAQLPMIDLLFAEGNPAGVKAALEAMGIAGTAVRLPLVAASNSLRTLIREEHERIFNLT